MACPADVIDYVIVHELSHIPHRNHGPGFWRLVARFDPDYKRHRQWLKEHETEIGRMFMAAEEASTSEDHCTPAQMAFEL